MLRALPLIFAMITLSLGHTGWATTSLVRISPSQGNIQGGTRIHLSGAEASEPPVILLDGVPCQDVLKIDDDDFECTTSPHPIGYSDVWIRQKSGKFYPIKNGFSFVLGLGVNPDPIVLPINKKLQVQGTGGFPPYSYSVVTGPAKVDSKTGEVSSSEIPGTGVLAIKDVTEQTFEVGYRIDSILTVYPETATVRIGEHLRITPLGGVPPYQFTITSGAGAIFSGPRLFIAPDTPGSTTIRITDGAGGVRESKVNIIVKDELKPKKLATGGRHSCVIIQNKVECWGDNFLGQLGDGTAKNSSSPVEVRGLAGKITSISAGNQHTCALVSGGLHCWGGNKFGQLGDGTNFSKSTPVPVLGLESGVLGFSTGDTHTCAVTLRGVFCWGRNNHGQFGNELQSKSSFPVRIGVSSREINGIYTGSFNTCVIGDHSSSCWGEPDWKELKNSTERKKSSTFFSLDDLTGQVSDMALGWAHLCGLVNGGVKCLGFNGAGNLGTNSKENNTKFMDVIGLQDGVTAIVAGQHHSCALKEGKVYCWGDNSHGELGDGSRKLKLAPVLVNGIEESVQEVSVGVAHSCAIGASGAEYCWGDNLMGQLGDGSYSSRTTPAKVVRGSPDSAGPEEEM